MKLGCFQPLHLFFEDIYQAIVKYFLYDAWPS